MGEEGGGSSKRRGVVGTRVMGGRGKVGQGAQELVGGRGKGWQLAEKVVGGRGGKRQVATCRTRKTRVQEGVEVKEAWGAVG